VAFALSATVVGEAAFGFQASLAVGGAAVALAATHSAEVTTAIQFTQGLFTSGPVAAVPTVGGRVAKMWMQLIM